MPFALLTASSGNAPSSLSASWVADGSGDTLPGDVEERGDVVIVMPSRCSTRASAATTTPVAVEHFDPLAEQPNDHGPFLARDDLSDRLTAGTRLAQLGLRPGDGASSKVMTRLL
jgi:hypothetical protein